MKVLIITPVYNEAKFLKTYIDSLLLQSHKIDKILFVDDNSTDESAAIIKQYAEKNTNIQYCYHSSENKKSQGKKVINAFNFGVTHVDINEFDIISKIDADLEFQSDYFELLVNSFKSDDKLGVCGGIISEQKNGEWHDIKQANYHVRGALKSYSVKCFKEIGGLKPILGWDGIDEMTSMFLGWKTKIINSSVKHYRPAAKDYDPVDLNFKLGVSNYQNGGSYPLLLIRVLLKMRLNPKFKVGISYFKGYNYAKRKNLPKNVSKDLAKFINNFHLKRLISLKRY